MIHMSRNAYEAVKVFPEFITEPRGDINIKVRPNFRISKVLSEPRPWAHWALGGTDLRLCGPQWDASSRQCTLQNIAS